MVVAIVVFVLFFSAQTQDFHLGAPMVIIDRSVQNRDADMVLLDNVSAAFELTEHLIANGYRKLAGLFGDASATGQERSQGFRDALKKRHLSPFALEFIPPRIRSGFAATMALLDGEERPDAILTSNSLLTAGAFEAIRERKLLAPKDVALVGFDETEWSAFVDPPITVIAQPTEEIGRTAIDLLFQRIAEPKRPPKTVIVKGTLIARGSSEARAVVK